MNHPTLNPAACPPTENDSQPQHLPTEATPMNTTQCHHLYPPIPMPCTNKLMIIITMHDNINIRNRYRDNIRRINNLPCLLLRPNLLIPIQDSSSSSIWNTILMIITATKETEKWHNIITITRHNNNMMLIHSIPSIIPPTLKDTKLQITA